MQVILLDRIHKLGNLGDTVNVKAGYGRNYLIPQGKAVPANAKNIAYFEARKAELEKEVAAKFADAQRRAAVLEKLELTISMLAGEDGKLYGSVGATELVEAIVQAGGEATKQEIQLPNGPLRTIGDHEVELYLHHGDVIAKLKVTIVVG